MAPALVYFVDVGQGDCSLIVLPDGSGILVDCASELAATSLMQDRGVSHLRAIVVTHLDLDHIGGLRSLLTHYIEGQAGQEQAFGLEQIDSLWIAQDRTRGNLKWEAYRLLALTVGKARGSGIDIRAPHRDDGEDPKIIWEQPGMVVELLLPFWADQLGGYLVGQSDGNPSSAVVRVRVGDARVVVCGDALLRSLEALHTRAPDEIPANVVRTSHHGGNILAKSLQRQPAGSVT
jgi:beta-lactamase superfamily II metal-dependent hydrolase